MSQTASKASIIGTLQALRERLSRIPTANDLRAIKRPSISAVRKYFGTWEDALESAFPSGKNEERQVLLSGKLYLYEAKAPFETSGKSVRGGIEYSASGGSMKCHECGEFFRSLATHIKATHGITARDYKLKHGLKMKTALVRDTVRIACSDSSRRRAGMIDPVQASVRMTQISAMSNHKKQGKSLSSSRTETHNGKGRCRLQTLEKIQRIAAVLRKTPSIKELVLNGVPYHDVHYHFGSVREAQRLAGLIPNGKNWNKGRVKFSEEFLIQQLRVFFYNQSRIPRLSDIKRGFFACSAGPYAARFGSWFDAIQVAFSPKEIEKDRFWALRAETHALSVAHARGA